MERAEDCCTVVHHAQLCTLALAGKGAQGPEIKGRFEFAQLESSFCLVVSEAIRTLRSLSF